MLSETAAQPAPDAPRCNRSMHKVLNKGQRKLLALAGLAFCVIGCSSIPPGTPPGAVVGRYELYDYSPSVIQTGTLQQFWWCGRGVNPEDTSQNTDSILYESIDLVTQVHIGPTVVLAETPGAWDSVYTCNPHVVKGAFVNPLGDGRTFAYAMYYVGTANGSNNSIGVAFSNDGIAWNKFPTPVVPFTSPTGYGPAQPVPYNSDQKQAVWLFYEDSTPPQNHHTEAVSADGIHFTTVGMVTTNGLDLNNPSASWGDLAYDPTSKYWYATYNFSSRDPSTTGKIIELGSFGIQLYRISQNALLTGQTSWQPLKNFDTNLTGYESVFLAAMLHDPYGNLYQPASSGVPLFTSFSNPGTQLPWDSSPEDAGKSGDPSHWDIGLLSWSPTQNPLVALNRYKNGKTHLVTSGWTDPKGAFGLEQVVGSIYEEPQNGATKPLYGCRSGNTDYFVSLDPGCEGQRILGVNGFLYEQPVAGLTLTGIYRCATVSDHFVSRDPACEGATPQKFLGYVLPAVSISSVNHP